MALFRRDAIFNLITLKLHTYFQKNEQWTELKTFFMRKKVNCENNKNSKPLKIYVRYVH